jgi:hypothetical protein
MVNLNQVKKSTVERLSTSKINRVLLFVHDTVLIVNLIF